MIVFAWLVLTAPLVCFLYAYALYPVILAVAARWAVRREVAISGEGWPTVSITVPAYNEEASIGSTLEILLELDYPPDLLQIVVVSDASTDRTDDIVRGFAHRGVELLRLNERRGKSAAENAVALACRGEILVNTDASIRIPRESLKNLVSAFRDPKVGVASGRDSSVSVAMQGANGGESGYVGYEMWVRSLETRIDSIVGASGCFYGIRKHLHETNFPEDLSRDFACALIAREHGFRAVSVDDAIAIVPRTSSLDSEYRRKIRTMSRGLNTLWYKRALLNPLRYGRFALMLFSHKLCRWLYYLLIPFAGIALVALSVRSRIAASLLVFSVVVLLLGMLGRRSDSRRRLPRFVGLCGFALASHLAGVVAWWRALSGSRSAMWEPTRRGTGASTPNNP